MQDCLGKLHLVRCQNQVLRYAVAYQTHQQGTQHLGIAVAGYGVAAVQILDMCCTASGKIGIHNALDILQVNGGTAGAVAVLLDILLQHFRAHGG